MVWTMTSPVLLRNRKPHLRRKRLRNVHLSREIPHTSQEVPVVLASDVVCEHDEQTQPHQGEEQNVIHVAVSGKQ